MKRKLDSDLNPTMDFNFSSYSSDRKRRKEMNCQLSKIGKCHMRVETPSQRISIENLQNPPFKKFIPENETTFDNFRLKTLIPIYILLPIQKNQKMSLDILLRFENQISKEFQDQIYSNSSINNSIYSKDFSNLSLFYNQFGKDLHKCIEILQGEKYHSIRQYVKKVFLKTFYIKNDKGDTSIDSKWPTFILESNNPTHSSMLSAFSSHLQMSEQIALVPIVGTKYQLIIFHNNDKLQCTIVPKFHLVLDIDDTLITSRFPKDANELPKENEQNLFIPVLVKTKEDQVLEGKIRFFISKRIGVEEMLLWASQLFNICFVTNGAYIYARAVLHYLDPQKKHILKYVGFDDESMKEILKSREDLLPHSLSKRIGLKKLQLFNLPLMRSVILDDDKTVWDESNQENILPFEKIIEAQNNIDYLNRVSEHIWKHLEILSTSY